LDERREFLIMRASSDPKSPFIGKIAMRVGEGLTGWVAREGVPLAIEKRAAHDARFRAFPGLQEDTFEAFLSVPVIAPNQRLVGVINVQHRYPYRHRERERTLVSIIGHQVGGAIENAHLYRRAERMAQELQRAAFRDGLTDLFNHRYFQEAVEKEIARAAREHHPLSLILFDVDQFKTINDTHGHLCGDTVLKAIANRLIEGSRSTDMVSRYGGEEFGMLLPETDLASAIIKAEACRSAVEATEIRAESSGDVIRVTVSLGVATYDPQRPVSKNTLLGAADAALYRSKCEGRNRVTVFSLELA
jgi:diguanylate cyclase (GGDEF)-like protein